jgi:hypothetical protein
MPAQSWPSLPGWQLLWTVRVELYMYPPWQHERNTAEQQVEQAATSDASVLSLPLQSRVGIWGRSCRVIGQSESFQCGD